LEVIRMKKYRFLATILVVVTGLIMTSNALASSQRSTFGQCGGTVYSGSQLLASWNQMGVSSQAASIAASAGFHRMDNSLAVFMKQRVVRASLARSASPIDFGCHPGTVFSVGPRLIPAGTPVMVALPAQLSKTNSSVVARKGFVRRMFTVHAVGKSNCSNPLRGVVKIWLWVKVGHKKVIPKKPVHKPAPKPAPRAPAAACITSAGYPLYIPLPAGVSVVNGICTTTTTVTTQTCKEGQTVSHDSNGNMICIQNTNTNTNTITVPVTVVVTAPPCNCSTPPPCTCTPPPPPPPPPSAQPPSCSNVTSPENGTGGIEADGTAYAGHVTVGAKNGDSITVTFGALYGSFPSGSYTFTSNGSDSVPWSYKAPSDGSSVGKYDVITVNVHDNTTGLNGQSCSSQPFVINAATPQV
jgi:hypothetical protein